MAYDGVITIGIVPDDSQWTRTLRNLATNSSRTISQAINSHVQPLGRITGEANEFQKSLAASNARVIAFGASAGAIFAIKSAFEKLISSTVEVERQLSEINNLFGLGTKDLRGFSSSLFEIASSMSVSFADAAKAASVFAHHGLGVEETLKRTAAALALSRTSGISYEESVQSLTSIMNSFTKEALDADDVVNRLAAVGGKYAASSDEIAEGLKRVGASANDANVSLNQTIGLITAAQQVTSRGGNVIGNSLKTALTRLQRPQVIEDLESVGVKARDANGQIRPMIEVLRSLANTYDTLASAQKAFVAETVGGVYQINILKAIMRDLGSGLSVYDGAVNVASNSTDAIQKRMAILNDTISSQLIRTMNHLTEASANVGTALAGGTLKAGLSSFDNLLKTIEKYSDVDTSKSGSGTEKAVANVVQAGLRGASNFIRGPGIQFVMYALLKLFERLNHFIIDSVKDLTGLNQVEKERLSINQGVAAFLSEQKELLEQIISGQKNLTDGARAYEESLRNSIASAQSLAQISEQVGSIIIGKGIISSAPKKAAGFIPNLTTEASEARKGGYIAGREVNTIINNGGEQMPVIANTQETITRVMHEGKSYDFINPMEGSPAANAHRQASIRQTGFDPYELPTMPIKAKGFVPNLALSPDLVRTIIGLGVEPKDIIKSGSATKMEAFTNLPENVVSAMVNRYRSSPQSLQSILTSMVRKGNVPSDSKGLYDFLRRAMLNQSAKDKGLYPDLSSKEAVQVFAESIAGAPLQQKTTLVQQAQKLLRLRPQDAQKMLDLHSSSFPFLAAYDSPKTLNPVKDKPNLKQTFNALLDKGTGERQKFTVNTPVFGHKSFFQKTYEALRHKYSELSGNAQLISPADFGVPFGRLFEHGMKGLAKAEGVGVGEGEETLDIQGSVQSILKDTNIRHRIAGMELKASESGTGEMAHKAFRTLVGEPGGKESPAKLRGPTGYVPPLVNIRDFNASSGGIGIIDADKFGEGDKSAAHYQSLIYAAVATGKPLRIHYGPMTTGKTTAAEAIVNKHGGLGDKGGDYVTDIAQIDSDKFKQFIINKTDLKHIDTGVFGLALSAASQVRGFYHPFQTQKDRQEQMIQRLQERNRGAEGKNARAIAHKYDEATWTQYGANMSHMQRKFGSRFSLFNPETPNAAKGFIPNLIVRDWEGIDDDMRNYSRSNDENYYAHRDAPKELDFKKNRHSNVTWDEEEGVLDIGSVYRESGESNPWAILKDFIKENARKINTISAGSIVGPRIPKVLQHFIQRASNQPELKGTELTGYFTPSILLDNAKSELKRGDINKKDFKQMVQAMKFLGVSGRQFHSMSSFEINRTLARGFVPNLSTGKFLGSGSYGRFYDLGRKLSDIPIGKKVFKEDTEQFEIESEYHMAKKLEGLNVNPFVHFPKTIGSLDRTLQRRAMGKEVFHGETPREIIGTHIGEDFESARYDRELNSHGSRVWGFIKRLQEHANQEIRKQGIVTNDFAAHSGNSMFNTPAIDIIKKATANPNKYEKLMYRMMQKPELVGNIANAMARQGGKMGVIDPGLFYHTALGHVPNLALPKNAMLAENEGYVPLDGPSYSNQLRFLAAGLGMDPEAPQTEIVESISKNHPQMFKKLWVRGMFHFPSEEPKNEALGFVPNLAIDLDKLVELPSFNARMKYAKANALMLGKGSSRAVFDMEDRVLKLAINKKGIGQNMAEYNAADESNPLLTRVFQSDAVGRYLVSEKARKLDAPSFKKMTGQKWSKFSQEMIWSDRMSHRGGVKTTSRFAEDVKQWALGNDMMMGDLAKTSSFGIVKRKDPEDLFGYERDQPAIIDYGFTGRVAREHYGRKSFGQRFVPNLARLQSISLYENKVSHQGSIRGLNKFGAFPSSIGGWFEPNTERVAIRDSNSTYSTFADIFAHEEFGHGMFNKLSKTTGFQKKLKSISMGKIENARTALMDMGYEGDSMSTGQVINESFAQTMGGSQTFIPDEVRSLGYQLISPRMKERVSGYLAKSNVYHKLLGRKLPSVDAAMDFTEQKVAKGFVPNLSWPVFPDYSEAQPGGVPVRRSSMGVSNNYWDRRIKIEIDKLMEDSEDTNRSAMLRTLLKKYGPEYGLKIHSLLEQETPQNSLWNNVKGFFGEREAQNVLRDGGVKGLTKLPESMSFDFGGVFGKEDVLFEVKNQAKIGNYDKFVKKIQSAHAAFPKHQKWIIGNEETRYTANGFVPNLSTGMEQIPYVPMAETPQFDFEKLRPFFAAGLNQYNTSNLLGHSVWHIARNVREAPQIQEEISRYQGLLQQYYPDDPQGARDSYYGRSLSDLQKRTGTRGIVGGWRYGINQQEPASIFETLSPALRRHARSVAIDLGHYHAAIQTSDPERDNAFSTVSSATRVMEERIRTEQRIIEEGQAREISLRRAEVHSFPRESPSETKQLPIRFNSSKLDMTGKELYVDYLTRKSYLNSETGEIVNETNPLKTLLTQLKKGNVSSIRATIIGPKIPAIMQQLVLMAENKKFPPGLKIDTHWTPADLIKKAEKALQILPNARTKVASGNKGYPYNVGDKIFSGHEITGYMTEDEKFKMLEALAFFRHLPTEKNPVYLRKQFAKGFIPNFYNAASEALSRENKATGGHAVLSSHPMLCTDQNPMGLAAIDSRSQSNAGEAINQHMKMGQSINEVKRAYTASGFIPNLVQPLLPETTSPYSGGVYSQGSVLNSVMLTLLSTAKSLVNPSDKIIGLKQRFAPSLLSDGEQAILALKRLTKEFDEAKNAILAGKTATFQKQNFTNISALERGSREIFAQPRADVKKFTDEREKNAQKTQRLGITGSIITPFVSGAATQVGEAFGKPSLAAGIDEVGSGLTLAAQTLIAFPTRLGKIFALSTAFSSLFSGVEVFSKGIHDARRNFETIASKAQKLTSQMDALATSLNSYDTMITDSAVSAEAIQREQRRYSEALAELVATPGPEGQRISSRLAGAPDTRTRQSILVEERNTQTRKLDLETSAQALREYSAKRTFVGSEKVFGVNPLGYADERQKTQVTHLITGFATTAIANLSSGLKEKASTAAISGTPEKLLQTLTDALSDSDEEIRGSAKGLIDTFDSLDKSIGPLGKKIVQQQIVNQLNIERTNNAPEKATAITALRYRNAQRQERIESAINQSRTSQRLFVNQGALQAGNQLDIRSMFAQFALGQSLSAGPESIAGRQAQAGIFRQQFGERTVKQFETATELKRIEGERSFKVQQVQTNSTRAIVEHFTQNFENTLKSAEQYRNAGFPEQGTPTISTFHADLIEAVNTGITSVVRGGNFDRFRGASGAVNFDQIREAIVKASTPNSGLQNSVRKQLQGNSGIEVMKAILEANKEVVSINQEALTESQRQTQALHGLMGEMDFKQLAGYLGGVKNLLDRSSRRQQLQNLVRGATLMTTGRSAEARSQGAATYLSTLQEMNVPLDPNKNNSLSKMIRQAFSIGITNLAELQKQTIGRAVSSTSRLTGGGSLATQAVQELAGRAGIGTAQAAFEAQFHPENKEVAQGAIKDITESSLNFDRNLYTAGNALIDFSNTVTLSKHKMMEDTKKALEIQAKESISIKKDSANVFGAVDARAQGTQNLAIPPKADSLAKSTALSIGPLASNLGLFVAGLLISSITRGIKTPKLGETLKGLFRSKGAVAEGLEAVEKTVSKTLATVKIPGQMTETPWEQAVAKQSGLNPKGGIYRQPATRQEIINKANEPALRTTKTELKEGKYVTSPVEPVRGTFSVYNRPVEAPIAIPPVIPEGPKPPRYEDLTRKQKKAVHSENFRAVREAQEKQLAQAQSEEATIAAQYKENFKPKTTPEVAEQRRKLLGNQPLNEIEKKIVARNASKANPNTAEGRKALTKLEKITGRIKFGRGAALGTALAVGATLLPTAVQAAQGGEGQNNQLFSSSDIPKLGASALSNGLILRSLKKGGQLAAADLLFGNIGEKALGGTKGELFSGVASAITAGKFFGKGAGVGTALGFGSELLRDKYTNTRFGEGAGFLQGLAGAAGAGALMGGGIPGAIINAGIYSGSEVIGKGIEAHDLNKEAFAGRKHSDIKEYFDTSYRLEGATKGNASEKARRLLNRLTGRERELKNREEADKSDFGGVSGSVMGLLGFRKQYGAKEKEELSNVTSQKQKLEQALSSNDVTKLLEALTKIQDELVKQGKGIAGVPETTEKGPATATVNSAIKVDISVKDFAKIPSEINDSIIGPLAEQLADLQTQVNELINQRSPRPSTVR